jgi:adenosylcobinamide-GDP ribazoletransferase
MRNRGHAMTMPGASLSGLAADLKTGIAFCTRLPLVHAAPTEGRDLARASWALPIAGALIGALAALVYWIAHLAGLPSLPSAALALAATLATTGCLHEDGLADTSDGFGGGRSRERKLEIMRDSRIGTFGSCALMMSLILRWSALASLADPLPVAMALIAAHASARATLPAFMRLVPLARPDGLSAAAGRPPLESTAVAAGLGVIALGVGLGPFPAIVALLLLSSAGVLMAWLSVRQVGGQTGDVLGALEQVGEIVVMLTAAALIRIGG